jgi:ribosomal protein S18 acetylase RimI-like enzyme
MTQERHEELLFRRPTDADYPAVISVIDEWWGGRRVRALLPRLWFHHFTGSSWIVESGDGRLEGFLVGFISPDHPSEAYVHMIGTNPNRRKRGVGRALYEHFFEDVRARGARTVKSVTWPGNQISVKFHTAIGFRPDDGPGSKRLYGTIAYPDDDGDGEDRVRFVRDL